MQIVRIDAVDTYDLRRRVLRDGTTSDDVVFDGDDEPTTFHLGVRTPDNEIVATSTWLHRADPGYPAFTAYQLRGMAIEPGLQGTGIGARLLEAGIATCAARGAARVWAHARSTALEFYLRHGFVVNGDDYVDDATGLPHVNVTRATAAT